MLEVIFLLIFELIKTGDLAQARSIVAFKRQRAAFFSDTALVLSKVRLPAILALRTKSNEGTSLGDAYADIYHQYRTGAALSEAFGPYLTNGEKLAMSGWDSTTNDAELAEGFKMVGQLATAFGRINSALWKSVIQATGSLSMALLLLYMMKTQIYPNLERMFPVAKWMFGARITNYVINGMFSNLLVFCVVFCCAIAAYAWSLPNWSSGLRRRLDHWMFYSWYRSYRSLQVLLALALHLQAKRGIPHTLSLIMQRSTPWETWYLEEMKSRNAQGEKGGNVFDVGFFDRPIADRIMLLSEAGSAEQAMEEIAFTSQKELLEQFRERIEIAGITAKNIALLLGVIPLALFFLTLGDYIVSAASSGFKTQ